jgi:GNAT superfamily N-acetyltransferase
VVGSETNYMDESAMSFINVDMVNAVHAARLIVELRTELNGRVVCTVEETVETIMVGLDLPSGGYRAVVAVFGGEAVGVMGMDRRFAVYAGGAFAQITEFYVVPAFRRRGVGAGLLRHAREIAVENGWRSIEVGAPSEDRFPATLRFYLEAGFRFVGPRLSIAVG